MQKNIFIAGTAMALFFCLPGWGQTTELSLAAVPQAVLGEVETVKPETGFVSNFGMPVTLAELSELSGGFDQVKNDMQLSGVVTNNSAVDVLTGSNYIADGSFSNSSGFPMVVQNSGSNVLIQNATIINLQYQ